MAVVVFDDFNKADNATSLGTAVTGQAWSQVSGAVGAFGISSNQAVWNWSPGDPVSSRVVVESGLVNSTIKVTLVDPTTLTASFGIGAGIVFRYVDSNFFWQLIYRKFPGFTGKLLLQRVYSGGGTSVLSVDGLLNDGDTIAAGCCGRIFEVFVNDVLVGTYDDSASLFNYGTKSGLAGVSGTYFGPILKTFDDFLVETHSDCPTGTGIETTFGSIYG